MAAYLTEHFPRHRRYVASGRSVARNPVGDLCAARAALRLAPAENLSQGSCGRSRILFPQRGGGRPCAWAPGGDYRLCHASCGPGLRSRDALRVAHLGARRRGDGGRRDGLLLGASLDPPDPVSLAFPRRAPQRRTARLSREFSRAPSRPGAYADVHAYAAPGSGAGQYDARDRRRDPADRFSHRHCLGVFHPSNFRWRLGPLEWVITTPGFHHWHHTYAGRERDCNYSSLLPWLDRVFGTHYLPKSWPERYGIHEPIARTFTGQLIQPMQASHATVTMDRPGT